jgi:small subunit ribosomal protein S2
METNPIIDKLFSIGAHFGYAPSRRHPFAARFIFGSKGGSEIFDLEKTAPVLDKAKAYVSQLASEGKTILFVGGKSEAKKAIKKAKK